MQQSSFCLKKINCDQYKLIPYLGPAGSSVADNSGDFFLKGFLHSCHSFISLKTDGNWSRAGEKWGKRIVRFTTGGGTPCGHRPVAVTDTPVHHSGQCQLRIDLNLRTKLFTRAQVLTMYPHGKSNSKRTLMRDRAFSCIYQVLWLLHHQVEMDTSFMGISLLSDHGDWAATPMPWTCLCWSHIQIHITQ